MNDSDMPELYTLQLPAEELALVSVALYEFAASSERACQNALQQADLTTNAGSRERWREQAKGQQFMADQAHRIREIISRASEGGPL